jgi:hypothetical protein
LLKAYISHRERRERRENFFVVKNISLTEITKNTEKKFSIVKSYISHRVRREHPPLPTLWRDRQRKTFINICLSQRSQGMQRKAFFIF